LRFALAATKIFPDSPPIFSVFKGESCRMEKVILAETPLTSAGAVDFEALVHAHARFVFKVAYAVLRQAEDAEDVVQETFFRAYRSGEAEKVVRMRSWLARIAWRIAIDRVRRGRGNRGKVEGEDVLQSVPASSPGAEESLLHGEKLALLERLLPALSRNLRKTLQLSTVEGMTSAEVAEVLRIPESSVRNRLSRARKLLKAKLTALTEGSYGS
jgi:RNA polymerase sigma-70 factor (ECF subfamily)